MTPAQFMEHLGRDSERFAAAAVGNEAVSMPGFDEWHVGDMVVHLGQVYAVAAANVRTSSDQAVSPGAEAEPPADNERHPWFDARRATMLDAVKRADLDAVAGSFAGTVTNGWWLRRMTHETAVHRWDVDAAISSTGAAEPIDSDLAADGIDEYLSVGLRFSSRRPDRVYPSSSLHLHRSDGSGEWMIVGDGARDFTVTHEHGKGDAAVRGPASSLLLWAWGRPVDDVEIFGDPDVAATWRALAP